MGRLPLIDVAGLPLHGANLFPDAVPELKDTVLGFMREATRASHAIMEGIALSLGLSRDYFRANLTAQPTLLAQDDAGGLQVRTPQGWIAAPPVDGALVCNIGDMLDRLTGGF